LQDHPEPVPLFAPLRWTRLLGETLIPWALAQAKNMKLLVRFLRKLEALGANMKKHPKAMVILREMIPFVTPEVGQAIEEFCLAEEAAITARAALE
jgi:hypothetical protein